jgi:hypothetical protein
VRGRHTELRGKPPRERAQPVISKHFGKLQQWIAAVREIAQGDVGVIAEGCALGVETALQSLHGDVKAFGNLLDRRLPERKQPVDRFSRIESGRAKLRFRSRETADKAASPVGLAIETPGKQ